MKEGKDEDEGRGGKGYGSRRVTLRHCVDLDGSCFLSFHFAWFRNLRVAIGSTCVLECGSRDALRTVLLSISCKLECGFVKNRIGSDKLVQANLFEKPFPFNADYFDLSTVGGEEH